VRRWWTDAFCVRYVKTFQAMSRPYQVADIGSPLLAALTMGWAASVPQDSYLLVVMYRILAGMYWAIFGQQVLNHIRGRFAMRRGVRPAPPGADPNVQLQKRSAIISAIMAGALFLLVVAFMPWHKPTPDAWTIPLFLWAGCFLQLSAYVRACYWDLHLE
jgi:drug/metabolite transporter (DMT)-like permease